MKFRGSLFYYGPGDHTLVERGFNRNHPHDPQFVAARFAAAYARRRSLRFMDRSDPAQTLMTNWTATDNGRPQRGGEAAPQARPAAAEARPYPCIY